VRIENRKIEAAMTLLIALMTL